MGGHYVGLSLRGLGINVSIDRATAAKPLMQPKRHDRSTTKTETQDDDTDIWEYPPQKGPTFLLVPKPSRPHSASTTRWRVGGYRLSPTRVGFPEQGWCQDKAPGWEALWTQVFAEHNETPMQTGLRGSCMSGVEAKERRLQDGYDSAARTGHKLD